MLTLQTQRAPRVAAVFVLFFLSLVFTAVSTGTTEPITASISLQVSFQFIKPAQTQRDMQQPP